MNSELLVVVTDADGNSTTLDSQASKPGDRPRGIQFGSQLGSGFYTASFTLARPIDAEHIDLHLGDDVRIIGADGSTKWEGWINALPRSMDTEHTVTVNCSGYMAHTTDEPFSMPFIDRDLSRWRPASRGRLVNLIAQTYRNTDASLLPDVTSGEAALLTEIGEANWITGILPCSEAWYDAGANGIGVIYYDWERANDTNPVSAWYWDVAACTVDDGSVAVSTTGNLKAATSTPSYFDASSKRFGRLFFGHTTSPNTSSEGLKFGIYWKRIAVYGDHGITPIGSEDPQGIAASDAMRWAISTYCPHLNTAGVEDTSYPIGHLVAEETTVYDFLLKLNSFHLWDLAVWEDRTLHFKQTDLTDWDWEIRHDEVGNQIGLQGDSFENLRNGIIVKYTDVATGREERLHPNDYAELRDDSIENPATLHGRRLYGQPFTIPFPTTAANALELGRIRLAEDLQVKAPGSFQVTGRIRDRSGQLRPVADVRSGDRIRLTSSANLSDRPRLIHEVGYSHDGQAATIGVDSTLRVVDAILDRTTTALTAAGLS